MPPNKRLGGRYPSSFCEWVVGTTIENAVASRAKRQPPPEPAPKQRDIVRIEVTTDDETEEDSLKVTYPRSGRTVVAPIPTDAVVKKVRFDVAPKKSALKKTVAVSSESETEASDPAPASKSEEDSSEAESSGSSTKKLSKTKRTKNVSCNSDSDADSEPHPTCKCGDCIRGRDKLKKQAKTDESQSSATESEASLSEADSSPMAKSPTPTKSKAKGGKKSPGKSEESEADDEASDSAKDSQPEDASKKAGPDKPKKDLDAQGHKQKGQKSGDGHQKEGRKQGKAEKAKAGKDAQQGKETQPVKAGKAAESPKAEVVARAADEAKAVKKKGKVGTRRTKAGYPDAFPGPHPCRPHLIEPIRAEVVQTERVIERPQDPPPNAYYDPAHGVLRLYHGPVYGGNHGHALYPRQYAAERPLPIGTPHPTQNPYFHGFNQAPPQPLGQAPMSYTQGMSMEPFNAMYPPPAFEPRHLSGFPPGGPLGNWSDAAMPLNGNRGAFSMTGANVASPRIGSGDKGRANDVAAAYHENPYIPRRNLSQFSAYGSRSSPTAGQGTGAGSGPDSNVANAGLPSNGGGGETGQPGADGASGGAPQAENTWNIPDQQQDNCNANGSQEHHSTWNGTANDSNGNMESNQTGGLWTNSTNDPKGPATSPPADGGGDSWGNSAQTDNPAPGVSDNNVMPGSFPQASGPLPEWGDPSAAASTGGKVDEAGVVW